MHLFRLLIPALTAKFYLLYLFLHPLAPILLVAHEELSVNPKG